MWLNADDFRLVIKSTPLISLDLVVQNDHGEILLGRRLNRPAKESWFVPGGRVLKNETLDQAFERLTQTELGVLTARSQCRFLSVFEHFYPDSVFGEGPGVPSTHYVVMAYQFYWQQDVSIALPLTQHAAFRWWSTQEASTSDVVHPHTKAYLTTINKE